MRLGRDLDADHGEHRAAGRDDPGGHRRRRIARRGAPRRRADRHRHPRLDGAERTYRLYLPSTFDPECRRRCSGAPRRLGWGDQFAETNHVEGSPEANGFVVVHPDGTRIRPRLPSGTWNGGYCCGPAATDQVDDVGFVAAVLDDVGQKVMRIDPSRTYAMGHSNGGIMSYRLACELGDRIVGIGVVGASLGVDTCTPPAPVSLLHIHGLADVNHPIDGGPGEGVADVVFRPAATASRRWRRSTAAAPRRRRPTATARPRPGPAATTTAPSPSCASPAHPMPGPVARRAGRCRDRPTRATTPPPPSGRS
ncbi:MAG: hypothetical protein R2690_02090 [Acidimicrobiales bacterium]